MINEQVLEEVRGSVMRKLRRRRVGKWSAAASVAVVCFALLVPTKQAKTEESTAPVLVGQAVSPAISQSIVTSPVSHQVARVSKRTLPKPEPTPEGPPPAYIKILTDDPNVVFLLVNSENGGTE